MWSQVPLSLAGEHGHRPRHRSGGGPPSLVHLRHLKVEGCHCARDKGPHSIWRNPRTGEIQAVPRHVEIDYFLAKKICLKLSVLVPPSR
jgi:mRNA interferase HicA